MTDHRRTDVTWQTIGEITALLLQAADQLWEAADTAGIDSPLHPLGLASFLAASKATEMLPIRLERPAHLPASVHDRDRELAPLAILQTAQRLTRQLDTTVAGVGVLYITVTDLVQELSGSAT